MSNHSGFAGVCCHRCVGGKCVYLFWDLGKAGEIPLFLVQIPLLILLGMHSDCALGSIPVNIKVSTRVHRAMEYSSTQQ